MNIIIRDIQSRDYPTVMMLCNTEFGNNLNIEVFTRRIGRMNADPNYKTIVAELDGETVGFLTALQAMDLVSEVGYLKINGLAVKKELRSLGIGKQLIDHIEAYAAGRGLSGLNLCSGFKRERAHAFYEREGFSKTSYCFYMPIKTTE